MLDVQEMSVVANWSPNLILKTPQSIIAPGSLWVPNKCLLLTNEEECIDGYRLDTELCLHPQEA